MKSPAEKERKEPAPRRAYSPGEIIARKYEPLPWGSRWSGPFGCPDINELWFISGQSASGKSSFVMQLAYELCGYDSVLYLSYEEGLNQSFQQRLIRFHMDDMRGRFRVAIDDTLEELTERLARPKSPHFIIVDSFQVAGWTYDQVSTLVKRFPGRASSSFPRSIKGNLWARPLSGSVIWQA